MKVSNIIRCLIAVSLFCYACGNPYEVDIPHWDYEDEDDKGENDGNSDDSGTDGKEYPVKYPEAGVAKVKTLQTTGYFRETKIKDGIIESLEYVGGCHGNTQGIAKLVVGMKVDDVIERLAGVDCGGRGTSCPDQLARALKEYKEQNA